jgi:hypothetical protein
VIGSYCVLLDGEGLAGKSSSLSRDPLGSHSEASSTQPLADQKTSVNICSVVRGIPSCWVPGNDPDRVVCPLTGRSRTRYGRHGLPPGGLPLFADRLGPSVCAARQRGDREQKVVKLNSSVGGRTSFASNVPRGLVNLSGFANIAAHFKRMHERPRVKNCSLPKIGISRGSRRRQSDPKLVDVELKIGTY